ncbi:putative succinate dehydrogenase (quinone) [Helianthus annuus]|nr:putative succinate dehydrogenase (quinone) [Helianthus annuus]KAJ0691008.1 putative succinate dehydrogenase (quinone) [Helianthus annuus]KAJ0735922.1 putative succinate dehydrogenase (quinone) [Helianthus annuus]KAJ0872677.1 putative succinate dehydrogenase (quinone) [Helianthus annuus]
MMTHDDHHQPINYNSTPPSFPSHWDFSTTDQDYENFGAFKGSCGEGCILRNEDGRFMEHYTPTMKDLVSRDVSRFTIMEYRTMCVRLLFICYLKDVPFYLLFICYLKDVPFFYNVF